MVPANPPPPPTSGGAGDVALGRLLVESGRLGPAQLAPIFEEHRRTGVRLGDLLVRHGLIDGATLFAAMCELLDRSATAPRPTPLGSVGHTPFEPGSASSSGQLRPGSGSGSDDHAAIAADPSSPRIGRYVLLGELGRGGMGIVYRALDPSLDRTVAIKVLGTSSGALSEQQLVRFEREARTAARLRHPAIVAVHEVGRMDDGAGGAGRPFLVMDLVNGESLEAKLRRRPPPPRRLAHIVREIARALEHAHAEGVVHRDVKPENVLVEPGRGGRVYLSDFGLAREVGTGSGDRVTVTGQIVGTPAYMAPEQASASHDAVGPATDIYSLGAVLYRALTGRPPFESPEIMVTLRRLLLEEALPPRKVDPSIHPDLETITLKCLNKDPADRYASAGALAEDLKRFVDGELILARPTGRLTRTRRWARRNRLLALLLAALVLLASGSAAAGAVMLAEMRARAAAERAAIVAKARDDAARAWHELEAARAEAGAAGAETASARRLRLDAALARGLRAVQAAETHHALAPDEPGAAAAAFRAVTAYGEVALAAEQWAVAAGAFERALELEVDDGRARALLQQVDRERTRVADANRRTVAEVIELARDGTLAERPGGREGALFTLVRLPEPQTVQMLTAALDEVTEQLRDVSRETYLAAAQPDEREAAEGEGPIEGLAEALDRWLALDPAEDDLDKATTDVLRGAARRIQLREAHRRTVLEAGQKVPIAREIVGATQERILGPGPLTLARLACEALGHIGIAEGAIEPLGRYLAAEMDEIRAASAAEALCRLGGERADQLVLAARKRFGSTSGFWMRVFRVFAAARDGAPAGSPEGPTGELSGEDRLQRAVALQTRGDLDGALAELTDLVESEPDNADALTTRGIVRRALGDVKGAIADHSRALELAPDSAPILVNRSKALLESGARERALADLDRAVELEPNNPAPRNHRGAIYREMGERRRAIEDFDRALELAPNHAHAWCNRGLTRWELGDNEGAIEDCTRAIEIDPEFAFAFNNRGMARFSAGDVDGAFDDLARALELDPDNVGALTNRGMLRIKRGDIDGALADMNRAIDVAPTNAMLWNNRAYARRVANDVQGLLEDAAKAIELDPKLAQAWLNRGAAHLALGNREQANADLARAAALGPDVPEVRITRAMIRMTGGDTKGALEDAERAVELAPQLAEAWFSRGQVRTTLGQHEAALADYDRAVELAPHMPDLWAARGMAKAMRANLKGALADLERYLELAIKPNPQIAGMAEKLRATIGKTGGEGR